MKIFVAGATGVLGRRAVKLLVEAGHDVTGIARSAEKSELLRGLGATPVRVDLFDAEAIARETTGHEVVMNLATHIPPPSKAVIPGAWKENDRIRTQGSRILVDAALAVGAKRYVQESIAFIYPDRGADWIDEDTPLDLFADFLECVGAAESHAKRFTGSGGTGLVLRFGQFYGHDTVHTAMQVNTARKGISTFLGPEDAFTPVIHLDDAAAAVVASLGAPAGTYNVVDDEPLSRIEMDRLLAKAVGRQKLRRAPNAVLKLGGKKVSIFTRSQRASNARFKQATGWSPRYPSAREGFPSVVTEMSATAG